VQYVLHRGSCSGPGERAGSGPRLLTVTQISTTRKNLWQEGKNPHACRTRICGRIQFCDYFLVERRRKTCDPGPGPAGNCDRNAPFLLKAPLVHREIFTTPTFPIFILRFFWFRSLFCRDTTIVISLQLPSRMSKPVMFIQFTNAHTQAQAHSHTDTHTNFSRDGGNGNVFPRWSPTWSEH
jgi:hypothetical protein